MATNEQRATSKKVQKIREEVETRKIGRNETWTFQGLFPRCYGVEEKPGKKHVIIVSFLMKRACMAD
jgi:hypothetical protein